MGFAVDPIVWCPHCGKKLENFKGKWEELKFAHKLQSAVSLDDMALNYFEKIPPCLNCGLIPLSIIIRCPHCFNINVYESLKKNSKCKDCWKNVTTKKFEWNLYLPPEIEIKKKNIFERVINSIKLYFCI